MSDLILPPGLFVPPSVQPQEAPEEGLSGEEKGTYLPEPVGYKILCALPKVAETFEGSDIVRPEAYAQQEAHATTVLFVVSMGAEAYKDEKKFPNGPWCKVGDFVLVRTYAGTRFKVFNEEMRLLNDDQIEAVVSDPRGITRI